jgi:hypothetical protein
MQHFLSAVFQFPRHHFWAGVMISQFAGGWHHVGDSLGTANAMNSPYPSLFALSLCLYA